MIENLLVYTRSKYLFLTSLPSQVIKIFSKLYSMEPSSLKRVRQCVSVELLAFFKLNIHLTYGIKGS